VRSLRVRLEERYLRVYLRRYEAGNRSSWGNKTCVPDRNQRLAENQHLFRTANERLGERVETYGIVDSAPFLCECADHTCLGRIDLTLVDYRVIRAEPNRFVILPGHAMVEGEKVIGDNGRYLIVEKERDDS
jgi:hypothetical protein